MNFPLFIARRIYNDTGGRQQVSRPAIRIATVGVAIGLAVMILSVCVVLGFKESIRDKVIGFGGHIQVQSLTSLQTGLPSPISANDSIMQLLGSVENVRHVQRLTECQGILKTDTDFMGIMFVGIGPEYDTTFLRENLTDGHIPQFSDQSGKFQLLISRTTADALRLRVGSTVFAYFISPNDVRARKFTIAGIYQTNMSAYDKNLCFTDIYTTHRLNGWEENQVSRIEVSVDDYQRIEETADLVGAWMNRNIDEYNEVYTTRTIFQAHPSIFAWLDLLDLNVWIILILMICVAGFTTVSGLLIIILERTQMIGTLKALGATNSSIRHTFLWFAVFIIGRGMLIGNAIGIGLAILQKYTGMIHLDPATYYVETVPIELNVALLVVLNIATLMLSVFVLVAPSYLVSHIHPAKAIKFD